MLWTHSPRGRRWFFRGPVNRAFLQPAHRFLHRALELWIATSDDVFGPVLNIDVGRDAFILYSPMTIAREEPAARSDHRSAIDERRRVGRVNQPAPGAFADQQTNLAIPEHGRH